MDRLHKKCVMASTGMHVLLAVILFVGPAFLAPRAKPMPASLEINVIPSELVDDAIFRGGNPQARPPAAAPVPVAQPPVVTPVVQPEAPAPPQPDPEPAKLPDKDIKPSKDPDAFEPTKPSKPKVQVSLNKVKRTDPDKAIQAKEAARKEQQQRDAERKNLLAALSQTASQVAGSASSATTIDLGQPGPGGGGPVTASYDAYIKFVYDQAWVAPEDAANDSAVAKATIVIARDGSIVSARISKTSGDPAVDQSVRRALEKVDSVRPFPASSKDRERTYIINFNLKAKRGLA